VNASPTGPPRDVSWTGDPARLCQSIVDQSVAGVMQADRDGRIVLVNRAWCRMTGYDEAELLGRNVLDLTDADSLDASRAAIDALRAGGPPRVLDKRYRRKDGSVLHARSSVSGLADGAGRVVGLTSVVVDVGDSVATAQALHRSERRYSELFEAIEEGFCIIEVLFDGERAVDYRFLQANPAFERETGLRGVVGRTMRELAPELEEHWYVTYGEVARSGRPVRFVQHAQSLAGRWFDVFASRVGEPEECQVALLFRDITGPVQAQHALVESEARLHYLANAAPGIVWSADAQGNVRYVSERWYAFTGHPAEAGLKGTAQLLHPDDRARTLARWRQAVAEGQSYEVEVRLRRHDGQWRWFLVRARPLRDANGRVLAWYGSSTDIEDRKRVEEALRLSEERMALALDIAGVGMWSWTPDSDEAIADARSRDIMGLPASGPLHKRDVTRRIHPDDWRRVERAMTDALQPDGPGRFAEEFRWVDDDGRVRWTVSHASALFADTQQGRRPVRVVGTARDVTARHATEEALREANQRKDEFLATLAHELRNPLAPLRNSLHLLRMGVDGEQQERLQAVMERQVAQLGRLVDDLLEVSRITRGKVTLHREPVTLDEVVHRAVETSQPVIDAARHALSVALPEPSVVLHADPLRLAQVLANLLNNAAKYTEPGGRIEVVARVEGDDVVVRVRDNGVGIAPEHLPHVFDLFAQVDRSLNRAQGGLGIGLTLVRSLVGLHGGSVVARSGGVGRGSEFEVRLPLHPGPQRVEAEAGPERVEPGEALRLLVVDDNHEHADTLALYLGFAGHHVRVAYNGLDAVTAAAESDPDAVLMDVGMPGLDGYEATRRIRAQPGGARRVLVALTGWGQADDRRRSRAAGFDAHLVKPADPPALLALVESLVQLKRDTA
jgi:PAS domain S-box-containing protein